VKSSSKLAAILLQRIPGWEGSFLLNSRPSRERANLGEQTWESKPGSAGILPAMSAQRETIFFRPSESLITSFTSHTLVAQWLMRQ